MIDDRLTPAAKGVLENYIAALDERLPGCVEAVYLWGSAALGASDHVSDLDFITVVNRELTDEDIAVLSTLHQEMHRRYPRPILDGGYLRRADIGKTEEQMKPYPFANDGILGTGSHNIVTWWILKHKGITVKGPAVSELNFDVRLEDLLAYVRQNMNSYWTTRIQQYEEVYASAFRGDGDRSIPDDMANAIPAHQVDFIIEWAVLGLLRQYYTLKEHDIISKVDAGYYGLKVLPPNLHPVVKEALRIRSGKGDSAYSTDRQRIRGALDCMHYIVDTCNRM